LRRAFALALRESIQRARMAGRIDIAQTEEMHRATIDPELA
jgi:hypothetical protein